MIFRLFINSVEQGFCNVDTPEEALETLLDEYATYYDDVMEKIQQTLYGFQAMLGKKEDGEPGDIWEIKGYASAEDDMPAEVRKINPPWDKLREAYPELFQTGRTMNKNTERKKIPFETIFFEVSKEAGISVIDSQMSMIDMDENAPAKCDLCSISIGPMKEVKHFVSPETISNAVKKGYKPHKLLQEFRDMLIAAGEKETPEIMEASLAVWKEVVDKGETQWALCEECNKEIQSRMGKND